MIKYGAWRHGYTPMPLQAEQEADLQSEQPCSHCSCGGPPKIDLQSVLSEPPGDNPAIGYHHCEGVLFLNLVNDFISTVAIVHLLSYHFKFSVWYEYGQMGSAGRGPLIPGRL